MNRILHIYSKLLIPLSLHKSSMPRYISLSTRELRIELSMRIPIKLHALDAAIGITFVGVEKAVHKSVLINPA